MPTLWEKLRSNPRVNTTRFLETDLWHHDPVAAATGTVRTGAIPVGQRRAFRLLRILVIAVRSLFEGTLTHTASSLAYTTLVSLVPTLAVALSLFKAMGGLESVRERLQELIIANLAVGAQAHVGDYLEKFIGNVNAGAIGGVGVAGLFVTTVSLLSVIEDAFNRIWGVAVKRPYFQRFTIYTTLILFAPLLLGVSMSVTATVASASAVQQILAVVPFGADALAMLARVIPLLLSALVFTLMYRVMPNTKIRNDSALIGGLTAAILWELLKVGYAVYSARAVNYSAIYGTLAAIPLFLLWIYLTWLVILFGAELAHAVEVVDSYVPAAYLERVSFATREQIAVTIAQEASRRFSYAEPPLTLSEWTAFVGAPKRLVTQVVAVLVAERVLAEATTLGLGDSGSDPEPTYLLACPPERATDGLVRERLREHGLQLPVGVASATRADP
jgi:membrane protein